MQGNDIGFNTRVGQLYLIPNLADGVSISSSGNQVGGDTAAAMNIIIDNGQDGVAIVAAAIGSAPTANLVQGNYIGTDLGTDRYGNGLDGVFLSGASGNTIGGTTSGAANVISGNLAGVVIQLGGDNLLVGNTIGTTAGGSNALDNTLDGITIGRSPGNTIGGTAAGAANVIAGNGQAGVDLTGAATTATVIIGNFIGTNPLGSDSLGNGSDGVLVQAGAESNSIGARRPERAIRSRTISTPG